MVKLHSMQRWFLIFVIIAPWKLHATPPVCKRCDQRACVTPVNCTHGLVRDYCYCCRVCAKREGEVCGGKNYINGECGRHYECVVRNTRNYLNRFEDRPNKLTGRCEPYSCAFEKCPFGQRCSILHGYTHCHCNISCLGMLKQAVCGETNNKFYKDECELRKDECQTGRRIGVSISPCPGSSVAQVSCLISGMKLEVVRKIFGRRRPRRLVLNDPSCKAVVNRTHVTVSTSLEDCGTKKKYTLTSVIYSNTLRTLPPRNSFIRRGKKVEIPFNCEFSLRKRSANRVRFTQVRPPVDKSLEDGKYTRSLGDGTYVEVDTKRNYTVVLRTLKYRGLKIKLMPTYCYATSLQRSLKAPRFVILSHSCPVEANVKVKSASDTKIVLQIPGIRFKNSLEQGTNIKCKVRICFPKSSEDLSKCEADCRIKNGKRRKRRSLERISQYKKLSNFIRIISMRRKPLFMQS